MIAITLGKKANMPYMYIIAPGNEKVNASACVLHLEVREVQQSTNFVIYRIAVY